MAAATTSSTSSALSLSGLASGFDWKTFVSNIIAADSSPINALQNTEAKNNSKLSAYTAFTTLMTSLQTSAKALTNSSLFSGTTAKSTNATSSWLSSSSSSTPPGSYTIAVTQLASNTQLAGTSDIGTGIASGTDVSGVTIGSMLTATAVTAGVFTVNGKQVTIATTDSLQDVFNNISTATSGAVTASYDPATDGIKLTSTTPGTPIVLGASNDSSNFLSVAKLNNNGTDTISSDSALGNVSQTAILTSAGLRTPITGTDGSGNGAFTINGVSISYNTGTDSISSIISKINGSTAGVTASYDTNNDRLILTNKTTGNTGLSVSDTSGNLLASLGVTGGTTTYGNNAKFTVNNGPTLTSTSNTITSASSGIAGLNVTVNSQTAETINVATDTTSMTSAVNDFISKYNQVISYIDTNTKVTAANGTVTTSLLSDDREFQSWGSTLRTKVFAAVNNSGSIDQLSDLGIDFTAGSDQLSLKDPTKLQAALQSNPSGVAAFFGNTTSGFASQISHYADTILGTGSGGSGLLKAQTTMLSNTNKSIDLQIARLQQQINAEQARLTSSFQAMESAESTIQGQAAALTKALASTSSSNSN